MAGTPRIAVVGSGPSGFYTVEALLRSIPDCRIDMIERLPMPHGLVRYGVAPDHQKLKQVAATFDMIALDPRFALYGGIRIGEDVSLQNLMDRYHAVVLATGSAVGRTLGVPCESLPQVYSSAEFVSWYNGHPDHVSLRPDLRGSSAAVIGNGNVALDVCRLLVRSFDDLRASDIPAPMLSSFEQRGVRQVHMIGRSAVTATKFSFKVFRQLADLPGVQIRVPQALHWHGDMWCGAASDDAARVAQWLRANACDATPTQDIVVNFWFDAVPTAFLGEHRVAGVALESARQIAAVPKVLTCDLAVSCIGYDSQPPGGVPIDPRTGRVRHCSGQVVDADGVDVAGLFVAGWIKRGPTGVIGTNRVDGIETARALVQRLAQLVERIPADAPSLEPLLDARSVAPISYEHWLELDRWEKGRGALLGKPREKLLSTPEAIEVLRSIARDAADDAMNRPCDIARPERLAPGQTRRLIGPKHLEDSGPDAQEPNLSQ